MGRTFRMRRKKVKCPRPVSLGENEEFLPLVNWLTSNGWKPTCKLLPAIFSNTGRGLMAKKRIPVGTTLVKIPFKLLITVKTVSESLLGNVLNNLDVGLTTQQVLTVYLAWEKHLNFESAWYKYISSLPKQYYSPLFCSRNEEENFPNVLHNKIMEMKTSVQKSHTILTNIMKSHFCPHCNLEYNSIFTLEALKWAWFSVNSRCVYISPDINFTHKINLIDSNCLALAPYLDMINHSNSAKVNAFFNLKDSTYTVTTSVAFNKYDEVFINYGSHSNAKLYLEYGFILPKNHHDVINLSSSDILEAAKKVSPSLKTLIMTRYDYLKKHDLLVDLSCSADGFSWNAKVTLFVLSAPVTANLLGLNRQVFSGTVFTHNQLGFITLARLIIDEKLKEINVDIEKIKDFIFGHPSSDILQICANLLVEYQSILHIVNKELGVS